MSTDYILEKGISIGEQRGEERCISIGRSQERKIIMGRLIAGGISPQQAAAFTGISV